MLPLDSLRGERVAVGLSGGADSVALLLRALEAGLSVQAFHFNHGFADECGDDDESFVRALCSTHAVPLDVCRCHATWTGKDTKEVFARQHRFAFFVATMRRHGIKTLLLAHHADDRAENMVLRLARGCGLDGLTSFTAWDTFPGEPAFRIVRPLLDETHAMQVKWLQKRGINWREDVSNADTSIPRNALRLHVAPRLPHFTAGANATADLLTEEHNFLHRQMLATLLACTTQGLWVRPETDPVLLRRALRHWLKTPLTRKQTTALLTLAQGDIQTVEGGIRVRRIAPWQWQRLPEPLPTPAPLTIDREGDYTFGPWHIAVRPHTPTSCATPLTLHLPLPLIVRARQPGDRLRPHGLNGTRKVQDLLVDLKIPATERPAYPLFFTPTGTLLALPCYRPATLPPTTPRHTLTLTKHHP